MAFMITIMTKPVAVLYKACTDLALRHWRHKYNTPIAVEFDSLEWTMRMMGISSTAMASLFHPVPLPFPSMTTPHKLQYVDVDADADRFDEEGIDCYRFKRLPTYFNNSFAQTEQ